MWATWATEVPRRLRMNGRGCADMTIAWNQREVRILRSQGYEARIQLKRIIHPPNPRTRSTVSAPRILRFEII
ncbi:uncharacterized protein N7459_007402 [Penicillium hispanicum]|uniref:uncharacterized protein n=1 Tax=Penicillium hispanicum TaxID=1080232 RepID=UPI002540EB98|nr:uncharacterized protein N7459_007402 [Penicillium hispanicum]KAJ5578438.1 hypothetical protein N7459_007402 [Penicillium hispanicum]